MSDAVLHDRSVEIHHTHRDVSGGWLRPAVFGAMDGLVSNVALIAGVAAAAGPHTHIVVVTGLAGLLAGAFSMAVGEWTSVRSQAELVGAEVAKERLELARRPEAEQAELALVYEHRGLSRQLARQVAAELSRDPERALRLHVQEELGVDPDAVPSPYLAAFSSLASFATGAFLPLAPYVAGAHVLWISLVTAAVGLAALGASVARFTARPPAVGAARQLLLGVAAAGVTYGVGTAFGVGLS
jgi:VIT1/CCC1 family predicted Fe2+/Mn2+ transporter